jgi:hypothetical protein
MMVMMTIHCLYSLTKLSTNKDAFCHCRPAFYDLFVDNRFILYLFGCDYCRAKKGFALFSVAVRPVSTTLAD